MLKFNGLRNLGSRILMLTIVPVLLCFCVALRKVQNLAKQQAWWGKWKDSLKRNLLKLRNNSLLGKIISIFMKSSCGGKTTCIDAEGRWEDADIQGSLARQYIRSWVQMKYDFKFLKVLMNVVKLGLVCNNLICFSSSTFIFFSNVLIKFEKDAKNYQVSHFISLFVSRSRIFTSTDTSDISNLI